MSKVRRGSDILQRQPGLQQIMRHARLIGRLQLIVQQNLPPAAAAHCQLANYNHGRLLLVIDNAHWATRLRYQQEQLTERLRRHPQFSDLRIIQFRVRPQQHGTAQQQSVAVTRHSISTHARQTLSQCAENIEDEQLRNALLRLANNQD